MIILNQAEFKPIRPGFEVVKKLYGDDTPIESIDHVAELKKMNRSLLHNLLELLDLLINHPTLQVKDNAELTTVTNFDPSSASLKYCWEIKLNHIEVILINMSFILNYYRPHQAREQMITILQNQLKRRKEITQGVGDCIQHCYRVLKHTQETLANISQDEVEFLKTVGGEPAASSVIESDSSISDFYVDKSSTMKRKRESNDGDLEQQSEEDYYMNTYTALMESKKVKELSIQLENVDVSDNILQKYFN